MRGIYNRMEAHKIQNINQARGIWSLNPSLGGDKLAGGNSLGIPWWAPTRPYMVGELEKGVGLEKCYIAQLFQFNIGPLFPQTSGFVDGSIL